MNCARLFRLATMLVPAAAITATLSASFPQTVLAETQQATPPASSQPASSPPATSAQTTSPPAATPPATPQSASPPSATTPAPSTPPAAAAPSTAAPAATPTPPPDVKAQAADPFGLEQTLSPKMVVALKGTGEWDSAFDTLTESLKTLLAFLDKQGIKPAGASMIVYTSTDDNGFGFIAEIPVDQEPKSLPKNITVGKSPEGKVLKFVHRGSYDNMDNTYEAITNHLDEKKLEAKDTFIEEYVTDPLKTEEDKLVINVFVPLK